MLPPEYSRGFTVHCGFRIQFQDHILAWTWAVMACCSNADSSPGLRFCGVPVLSSDSCAAETSSAVQMSSLHSGMVRKDSYQSIGASQVGISSFQSILPAFKCRQRLVSDHTWRYVFLLILIRCCRVKQEKYISAYYNDVCSSSKQLNMRDMKIYNSRRLRLPVLSSSNASGPIVSLAEIQRGMRGAYTWSKFLEAANSVAGDYLYS
ncbi:hypothetical protein O6H91_04G144200 [Diphasiastrum complanatum]|uniref:Uncharacterized protein n=1 Tax=Diphasiastrum complanatum TaxID=34168 RepID=A0ACC2E2U8_DIPCM|nr:hypothetical protein O6H91_04G144200 [Diphasiastrum complanatum]